MAHSNCPPRDPSNDRFRQTRSLKKRSKPLTAHNLTKFRHSIPLKVTLAIRSDFPRRFEQAFRSNSKDIFGDLSTQHGELEWKPPNGQPIRFCVGEQLVWLERNNWSQVILNNLFFSEKNLEDLFTFEFSFKNTFSV